MTASRVGRLSFRTIARTCYDEYSLHKVSYQTQEGVRIPAYLLEPSEVPPPWPAVLVIHGCGYGKAGPAGLIDDIHNSLGVELARAGFLVLIPDRRGFGELQPVGHYIWPSCSGGAFDGRWFLEADARAAFDTDLRSLDVFDLLVAVDYLAARDDVTVVGLAGLSGGGVVAEYVAGQTEKVAAVVLANSMSYLPTAESAKVETTTATLQFGALPETPLARLRMVQPTVPSLGSLADTTLVLLALLPPRPVLIEYGNQDPVNYLRGGEAAIELVRSLYARHGVAEKVFVAVEPGGHEFFPRPIIQFFSKHLNGQ